MKSGLAELELWCAQAKEEVTFLHAPSGFIFMCFIVALLSSHE